MLGEPVEHSEGVGGVPAYCHASQASEGFFVGSRCHVTSEKVKMRFSCVFQIIFGIFRNGLEWVLGSGSRIKKSNGWFRWSQLVLKSRFRMTGDDCNDHIKGDKGNHNPADDEAGLPQSALQPLMLSLLPLTFKVHQVVSVVLLVGINLSRCFLGKVINSCNFGSDRPDTL